MVLQDLQHLELLLIPEMETIQFFQPLQLQVAVVAVKEHLQLHQMVLREVPLVDQVGVVHFLDQQVMVNLVVLVILLQ